ncbi:MAG: Hsp20/alpha crystallin family protein [Candidatus Peribacteraceae bacterium]|jgi:HSP20 family protein
MSHSPFHGIFSALGSGSSKGGFPWDEDDETVEPAESPRLQAEQSGPNDGVGRVAVDIFEYEGYYVIKAPIAGVRMADLDIEVNENTVTIRGTRRQADAIASDQYYLEECFWGPFSRSVTLPCPIDPKKVRATFNKECILKVLVPKEEKAKSVRILEA